MNMPTIEHQDFITTDKGSRIFWNNRTVYADKKPEGLLIAKDLLKTLNYFDTDSWIVHTNWHSLKSFLETIPSHDPIQRYHRFFAQLLGNDLTPRHIDVDATNPFSEIPVFLNGNKLTPGSEIYNQCFTWCRVFQIYEFLITTAKFRTPFSIGNDSLDASMWIHPGNTRILSMCGMQHNIDINIWIPNDSNINKTIVDWFLPTKRLKNLSAEEINLTFELNKLAFANVVYSKVTGVQIRERTPLLYDYRKKYTVEWTGKQFLVNNKKIAKLVHDKFAPCL